MVQRDNLISLRASDAEPNVIMKSDPDISKYEDYKKLDTEGFSLKAI